MKHKAVLTLILVVMLAGAIVQPALANSSIMDQLTQVKDATDQYHNLRTAQSAGYNLVPGLDSCFNKPGVGAMGYHYINVALLDTTVDPRKPEALVYGPGSNGKLALGAVEYIVPAAAWNAIHAQRPSLFGQTFELNQTLGVYTLHAWIWRQNSLGMFFDWNPKVSCP